MKEAFLKSIRMIYPDGVTSREQFRDVIRIYSMGWCDVLMSRGDKDAVAGWCKEFEPIAAVGWYPDASWKWWVGPTNSIN